MADKDANCRLRHGLNVHCFAHIFQYIDSADLYTVGGMNEFYHHRFGDPETQRFVLQIIQTRHYKND